MYLIDVVKEMNVSPDELTVGTMLRSVRATCPGFFTPLRDFNDAGKALISPITDSLILGLVSAVLLREAALAVGDSFGLGVRAQFALYHSEYRDYNALTQAVKMQVGHAVALTFSAIGFALLTALAAPVLALHALTRVVSTIAPLIANGFITLVDICAAQHRLESGASLDPSRYP